MIYVAWMMLLALGTWGFQTFIDERQNPNQAVSTRMADGAKTVVLERNRAGHFVANGAINGHEVTFLIDTGATDVAVPAHIADRIGLKRMARARFRTANGVAEGYLTRLDRVSLGEIEVSDVRGSINANPGFDHVLLGMSFLRNLEFTQRAEQLVLKQTL